MRCARTKTRYGRLLDEGADKLRWHVFAANHVGAGRPRVASELPAERVLMRQPLPQPRSAMEKILTQQVPYQRGPLRAAMKTGHCGQYSAAL
jgi:hypothetical protein